VKVREQFLNDYSFERAGNEFYRAGDTDRAIEKYRQTLEMNPDNVTAHQRLGFLLYHVKRQFQAGQEHTERALRLDPRNSFAHSDLGVALLNQNQPAQAVPHLEAALASLPWTTERQYQPAAIRHNLGQACLHLGRFAEATGHLKESVRLDPTNAEAHYLLALAWAREGALEDALRHYAQAVALKPEVDSSVALHELLAENYAKAGRLEDAIRSAEQALRLARASGKTDLAERVSARLQRYKANLPPAK
jgi:tetratricopeptide (TPR) repeat protein